MKRKKKHSTFFFFVVSVLRQMPMVILYLFKDLLDVIFLPPFPFFPLLSFPFLPFLLSPFSYHPFFSYLSCPFLMNQSFLLYI